MPLYRVVNGYTWGRHKEHKGGDTVELTEHEAAPFLGMRLLAVETVATLPEPEPPVVTQTTVVPVEPTGDDDGDPLAVLIANDPVEPADDFGWGTLPNKIIELLEDEEYEPEDLAETPDAELREIDGIGPKALSSIREIFPYESDD